MRLWGHVRALLFARDERAPTPTADDHAPASPTDADVAASVDTSMSRQAAEASIASRQERAAVRILEDERLRGDLTDDEFQPLLDWALGTVDRVAESTAGTDDAEADVTIDAAMTVIREVVGAAGAAVVAHNEGDADRRTSELEYLGTCWDRASIEGDADAASNGRLRVLAERLDEEPGLTGPEVSTLVVQALERPNADEAASLRDEGKL